MREIKFRAWDKILNKFVECSPEQVCLVRGGIVAHSEIELMQYTGLKDKNGKEVYEGDIFKFYSPSFEATFTREVKWFLEATMFDCESEVIGNIYENPELLKEDK